RSEEIEFLHNRCAETNSTMTPPSAPSHPAQPSAKPNPYASPDFKISSARNLGYPYEIWYFFAGCIALLTLVNITSALVHRLRRRNGVPPSPPTAFMRLPAALKYIFRRVAFYSTVSFGGYSLDVAELFMAVGYIGVIFTWAFVNTTSQKGQQLQFYYWTNRAAYIVSTQFPMVVALGMRNNIIGYLTGISLDKLNLLHRVAARALCVLIWVHGGSQMHAAIQGHYMTSLLQLWWVRWGITAVTAFTLLCTFSVRLIRQRAYETFLIGHLLGVLFLLVGAYHHTKGKQQSMYIWPSFVIWAFDRALRFIRTFIVNSGYTYLLGKSAAQSDILDATVDVISPHFLRVSIMLPSRASWRPAQIAYLAIPNVSQTPWEAHPFSIASLGDGEQDQASIGGGSSNSGLEKQRSFTEANALSSASSSSSSVQKQRSMREMVFLIRVHRGFTRRLLDAALAAKGPAIFGALVDGPHCTPPSALGYASVLLLAGGSGVSFTLPLLLDLLRAACAKANLCCARVVFVWSVRESDQIPAISPLLFPALISNPGLDVDIRIHVTQSREDTDGAVDDDLETPTGPEESDTDLARLQRFACVRVQRGRPDIDELLASEIAAVGGGSMAVNVCGTRGLANHVRRALRRSTSVGGSGVSLHVESFGGA
ncbi:unnamed protein product, partial [Mycena citricolor]